jgi:hypothetical protein
MKRQDDKLKMFGAWTFDQRISWPTGHFINLIFHVLVILPPSHLIWAEDRTQDFNRDFL